MANYKLPLELFDEWNSQLGEQDFLVQPWDGKNHKYNWNQVNSQCERISAYLQSLNLPKGSKIGIVSKNCAHWVMADLAIMMSGFISVPLYPNINNETINYVLKHSECSALFVGKLDDWKNQKSGVPEDVHCISFPLYEEVSGTDRPYTRWGDIINNPSFQAGFRAERSADETMTIIYTSGTTGTPKGVVHSFHNAAYAIEMAKNEIQLGKDPRFFSYLPLSHIAERLLVEMGALRFGGTIFFAESLETFPQDLQTAQPSVFLGVPRIWTKFKLGILAKMDQKKLNRLLSIPIISGIVKKKIKKALGLQNAKVFLTGAAPTPPSLIEWYQKLGIPIQEVYGMTENTAYSHFNRKGRIRYGSAGLAMPEVEVKINDSGEILIRHEAIMTEYYKEPEKTAETVVDGWLHTGDCGHVDQEGYLFITGRVKDIFKTAKGKYVSPNPIEMKISKNKAVEQVCLTGCMLPQPVALIVLSEEAHGQGQKEIDQSLNETMESLNKQLESHERIKKMIVVKEPWTIENALLTPTMKIKRSPIENKYSDQFEKWYESPSPVIREV